MRFFQIIRWKNLMIIALVQALIKYHLIPLFDKKALLSDAQFFLLVIIILLIAAAGYIINDIEDLVTDSINKPENVWIPDFLSKKKALILYYSLNSIAFVLAVYFCYSMDYFVGILWFIIPVLLLFVYAKKLKSVVLLGNILVSALVAYSIVLLVLFEKINFFVSLSANISFSQSLIFLLIFAFFLSLAREIVKDIEDETGDRAMGVRSIPIVYGIEVSKRIIFGIFNFLFGIIVVISIINFKNQPAFVLYLILGVSSGFALFLYQLKLAKNQQDFTKISMLLKLLFFVGIISVLFINMY